MLLSVTTHNIPSFRDNRFDVTKVRFGVYCTSVPFLFVKSYFGYSDPLRMDYFAFILQIPLGKHISEMSSGYLITAELLALTVRQQSKE